MLNEVIGRKHVVPTAYYEEEKGQRDDEIICYERIIQCGKYTFADQKLDFSLRSRFIRNQVIIAAL